MEMSPEDWILMFGLNIVDPISVLVQRTVNSLIEEGDVYEITDIVERINQDTQSSADSKTAAAGLFESAETWGIFSESTEQTTQVKNLINAGMTSVLDLSVYNAVGAFNVRALVISLVSRKIFNPEIKAMIRNSFKKLACNPIIWIVFYKLLFWIRRFMLSENEL